MQHTAVSGLSLKLGTSESRKTLEQKFIFQIGILIYIYINIHKQINARINMK